MFVGLFVLPLTLFVPLRKNSTSSCLSGLLSVCALPRPFSMYFAVV